MYAELLTNQIQYYRTVDPRRYFNHSFYDSFVSDLQSETTSLEQTGFSNYAAALEQQGKVTTDAKNLAVHIYNSVDTESPNIPALIEELENNWNPDQLVSDDMLYCYLYHLALTIYNDYYQSGNAALPRGNCDFVDFVQHVIKNAITGAGIGGWVGAQLKNSESFLAKLLGFTLEIPGGIIGGVIGGLVGVFSFDNDCDDCERPKGIAVQSDGDCDLTRDVLAFGAGSDVAAYVWTISQGGNSIMVTTPGNIITITQNNSNERVGVSAAAVCEDGQTAPSNTEFVDLNTSVTSPLGQVGRVSLLYSCPYENQWGEYVNRCFHIDADVSLTYLAANDASGHIEYVYSLTPASRGEVINNGNNSVRITWNETGEATLTVTATNTCSGLSETESLSMNVMN